MADADNSAKPLLYVPGRIKIRLNNVQRAEMVEKLERSCGEGCLVGNSKRLAARVRRGHVRLATVGCHFPATCGFFSRGCRAREHACNDRRSRKYGDQEKNADFDNMLHCSKVYKRRPLR